MLYLVSILRKLVSNTISIFHYIRLPLISYTTGATNGTWTAYPCLLWDLCSSTFIFLCSVCQIFVYRFVLFRLTIVLSVLFRFMVSDYHFLRFFKFLGAVVVVFVWQLDLLLPVQSMPIATNVMSSNPAQARYNIM